MERLRAGERSSFLKCRQESRGASCVVGGRGLWAPSLGSLRFPRLSELGRDR